ncbi:checkpoint protein Hus1/Mec3 [Mycena floridula]|nr:checkpoint protein Hus1/Mec3 [Mycena floridula]
MRFRATIDNVPTFYRIIQAIEKLQKKCIIKFSETNMQIICNDKQNEGGIQVWSQIKITSLFTAYRIQSNAANEITMALSSEALLAALKSASSSASTGTTSSSYDAEEIVMKLAKKNNQALLTFEIIGTTKMGKRVRVAHDVRVEVMKQDDVERLREPMCPEPDTHVLLPPLQKLRLIIDRMRPMSDVLSVRADNNGCLKIGINTESVNIETEWKNCANTRQAPELSSQEIRDPNELFTVLISSKSFAKFLNSHVVSTTTIACICQNHCMILYVYIGDVADAGGVLTFYIPAIIDDDEL